jgi:hypothetical protein
MSYTPGHYTIYVSGKLSEDPEHWVYNFVHEMGHVYYDALIGGEKMPDEYGNKYCWPTPTYSCKAGTPVDYRYSLFGSHEWGTQQHPCDPDYGYEVSCGSNEEVFADMFTAETYDGWDTDPDPGAQKDINSAKKFMQDYGY